MALTPEEFKSAYSKLPPTIRTYLAGDELGEAVQAIATAFNMHVDTTGVLADALTETLLGYIRPDDLPGILIQRLGIDRATANNLITKINSDIFIPLQKRVRETPPEEPEENFDDVAPEPAPVAVPINRPAPLPPPAVAYQPPAAAPVAPTPAAPQAPSEPAPANQTVYYPQLVTSQPMAPVAWHPQPSASFHVYVPPAVIAPQQPPYQAPYVAPPANLPGQIPPAPVPQQPAPMPLSETPQTQNPTPLVKDYTADPYREPI